MTIISILPIFAGIGLFLFGMSILGGALEKVAGAKLEKMLERLTSNRIKGVLLGTAVTGVIQSSSATTIMVIGLLNAGIIKLSHSVPVVMGANIGTTITGQILRLGDLGDTSMFFMLLKPSSFGPILIGIGSVMNLFCNKKKYKDIGLIMLGLGMLFFGMNTMEVTLLPLREQPWFQDMFFIFNHPLLGILLGAVMTAILQSSSASVGILQALASTGAITFSAAVPIILGQNVGKCITVILASIGSKRNAKRAVFIDVFTNMCGMILFFVCIYSFQTFTSGFSFWDMPMTRGNIADFHTLFNIVTTIVLLPFISKLIQVSCFFIKEKEPSKGEQELDLLDDLLLATPHVAVEQCKKTVLTMSQIAIENYQTAIELLFEYTQARMDILQQNENLVDKFETALDNYIVKITALNLKDSDSKLATEMLHAVGDLERISDHAVNIAEVAQYNKEHGIEFSLQAQKEITILSKAVKEILNIAIGAYQNRSVTQSSKVEPLEQVIDMLQYELKEKHIERLSDGKCNVQAGISFLELLGNMERISDHCSNIAVYVVQDHADNYHDFSAHVHLYKVHTEPTEEYKASYHYFSDKYKIPKIEKL